jgi:hypothetical protein
VKLDIAGIVAATAVIENIMARENLVSVRHEGSGLFWFWPPVAPRAKQLYVTVSTLREAAGERALPRGGQYFGFETLP